MPIQQMAIQPVPLQPVPLQSGPLQSGPLQQVKLTESAPEGAGEYPSSALLGAPVPFGRGRQSADQAAPDQQMPDQQMPIQPVPLQSGPLQSGPLQQVKQTESAPEGTGEYPEFGTSGRASPLRPRPPVSGSGRNLAGWTSGELPVR